MSPRAVGHRVVVVHWHAAECAERAARLTALGYVAQPASGEGGEAFARVFAADPAAVVIDLGRLPSHGRQTALALRERKATRHVPLVFVDGAADKVARVRADLPDATFTTWAEMPGALRRAIARPPVEPVRVRARADACSGTPFAAKLGIGAGARVAAPGAPKGFAALLAPLPQGAVVLARTRGACEVIVLFSPRRADLARRLPGALGTLAPGGSLWIAWPKKAAGVPTDLGEDVVRQLGLAAGVVDTKVCAIDATWSGLRFQRRRVRP